MSPLANTSARPMAAPCPAMATDYVDIHARLSTHLADCQRIADSIPALIWGRNAASQFVLANRAFQRHVGLSIENMRRRDMRLFGDPGQREGDDYARFVLRERLAPVATLTRLWSAELRDHIDILYAAVPVLRPGVGGYGGHLAIGYPLYHAPLIVHCEALFRRLLGLDDSRPPQRAPGRQAARIIPLAKHRHRLRAIATIGALLMEML